MCSGRNKESVHEVRVPVERCIPCSERNLDAVFARRNKILVDDDMPVDNVHRDRAVVDRYGLNCRCAWFEVEDYWMPGVVQLEPNLHMALNRLRHGFRNSERQLVTHIPNGFRPFRRQCKWDSGFRMITGRVAVVPG